MFLGHSQKPTGQQKAPIFLLETVRPRVSLRQHMGTRLFRLEPKHPPVTLRHRQEPVLSLQEHPEFFRLLNDERFRQELRVKPVEVLARFGVQLRAEDVPQSIELPVAMCAGKALVAWFGLL